MESGGAALLNSVFYFADFALFKKNLSLFTAAQILNTKSSHSHGEVQCMPPDYLTLIYTCGMLFAVGRSEMTVLSLLQR